MKIKGREPLLENADVLDATLCCLAGADFLLGKLMPPENKHWQKRRLDLGKGEKQQFEKMK